MITVDGTFCQAALKGKIHIKEQLPKYIGSSVQLCILPFSLVLTDQCVAGVSHGTTSLVNHTTFLGWHLSIGDYKQRERGHL